MPYRRKRLALFVVAIAAGAVCISPATTADADLPSWNGKYALVRYAADKTGTSMAARQPEPALVMNMSSSPVAPPAHVSPPSPKVPVQKSHSPTAAAVHLERKPVGAHLRLAVGLLCGGRSAEGVGPGEVVGVLRSAIGRVLARNLADRHIQRRLPGHSDHAGGGLSRPARSASVTEAARVRQCALCVFLIDKSAI